MTNYENVKDVLDRTSRYNRDELPVVCQQQIALMLAQIADAIGSTGAKK